MKTRGESNVIGLAMLAGLAAAIYLAVLYMPLYMDHLTVKEAVDAAVHSAERMGDEGLKQKIIEETSRVGVHDEVDANGETSQQPGLGIQPDQITIDRLAGSVRVTVRYERELRYKPSSKTKRVKFTATREGIPQKQ